MSTSSVLSDVQATTASAADRRADSPRPSVQDISVRELIDLFEQSSDVDSLQALRTSWVESVGAERAAVELTKVMRSGSSRERATAFFWLTDLHAVAEAAVRVALEEPTVRPYGVVWLRESGFAGPDPTPEEVRWLYVDLLAVALDDEERLAAGAIRRVSADGSADEQARDVTELWRSDHPKTAETLDMLARRHPEPLVAEAARRAASKVRSGA